MQAVCTDGSDLSILTPAGQHAVAGRTQDASGQPCNELQRIDLTIGHYERTGAPLIAAGKNPSEKIVTLPGHWVPSADGELLRDKGYATISVVDRKEIFTYVEGRWARRHPGR